MPKNEMVCAHSLTEVKAQCLAGTELREFVKEQPDPEREIKQFWLEE